MICPSRALSDRQAKSRAHLVDTCRTTLDSPTACVLKCVGTQISRADLRLAGFPQRWAGFRGFPESDSISDESDVRDESGVRAAPDASI